MTATQDLLNLQANQQNLFKGGMFLVARQDHTQIFTPEDFDDVLRQIADTTSTFVEREVMPVMADLEAKKEGLNRALLRRTGELGLTAVEIPEEYGGLDLPKAASVIIAEKTAKTGGFGVTYGAHQSIGSLPTVYFGNAAQKEKYLPQLATAEMVAAYCLTEPSSGSDAQAAKTTAVLSDDGSYYTLNGSKMWISNGGIADLFTVFAQIKTPEGNKFSAFLVERAFGGVSTAAEEHKMGIRSSSTVVLNLDNVRVPAENLLGGVGVGAKIAFNILNVGRYKLGAGGVGGAKDALELSTCYALEREQFGQAIANFGAVQEKLANIAIRTYAVESALYRLVGLIDSAIENGTDKLKAIEEYAVEASILKVLGSELLDYAVDEGVQIHGGVGYSQEYAIERAYRDSRINRIFEGTNEINRLLIPGHLLKRAMKGELPLMQAAQKLQSELMEFSLDENESDEPLTAEARSVENLKKLALMIAGAAAMKYGPKLESRQEVLMRVADIVMLAFAGESAVLRTRKLGLPELQVEMTQVYVYEAAEKAATLAREALGMIAEGDEQRVMLSAVKRFTKHEALNTIRLRRHVTKAVLEQGGYPAPKGRV
ncbi:acyl-CoA dehydrogenase family protein [Deinococcus peraridilitoris]|uniref:Acyl-CoA dehydrogenase n=1 Tax=Deinococcus peraridilitoris (strain DSM 19664 / LMG 22246 / CIP 109416 / KR-200) TaxID=937777 RepID=L0A7R6_DEIPD|nr:acyl-CoA dehydrogenase family protein [Deinococcus peraridilitoris]AFZ69217.1 acyl-CoA dehydrogenase [Deinococcus peraridilitoris DSM 19664]